jgi:hypothetical protein
MASIHRSYRSEISEQYLRSDAAAVREIARDLIGQETMFEARAFDLCVDDLVICSQNEPHRERAKTRFDMSSFMGCSLNKL